MVSGPLRGGTQLDQTILWNEIGASIESARRAHVLFVGSSSMQFAIPAHEVRAFERRTGLEVFSLAMPGEGYAFPLRIIERFDLRPRVVVASITTFVPPEETNEARRVRDASRWNALATIWEARLAELAWPIASRVLPSFVSARPDGTQLRSADDGTWRTFRFPHRHIAVRTDASPFPIRGAWASRFAAALARRGIRLVLTCVPTFRHSCSTPQTKWLADTLGVPWVNPHVDGELWTNDMVHLCPLSGKRFGRALFRELGRLDVIRGLRRPRPPVAFRRRVDASAPIDPGV